MKNLELCLECVLELLAAGIDMVNDLYGQFMHYARVLEGQLGEWTKLKREVLTRTLLLFQLALEVETSIDKA